MIGKVIDGLYTGANVNKLPNESVLYIETEDGNKIALSKKNVISIENVTEQHMSSGGKCLLVLWNDFETSVIQIGVKTASSPIVREERKGPEYVLTQGVNNDRTPDLTQGKKRENISSNPKTKKKSSKRLFRNLLIVLLLIILMVMAMTIYTKDNKGSSLAGKKFESITIDKEQRIQQIKDEGLVQAKEYIRKAVVEEIEDPEDALSTIDNIEVTYGLEITEENIYTVTATYKFRLELSNVHSDIYYICDIIGDLRTGDTEIKLLDYYTGDPEFVVNLKEIYDTCCSAEWATYKKDENSEKIVIDTNPTDEKIQSSFTATFVESRKWYNKETDVGIQAINRSLGLPADLRDRIVTIGATDPTVYEYFDGYVGYDRLRVAYDFHPNRGLEVQYLLEK